MRQTAVAILNDDEFASRSCVHGCSRRSGGAGTLCQRLRLRWQPMIGFLRINASTQLSVKNRVAGVQGRSLHVAYLEVYSRAWGGLSLARRVYVRERSIERNDRLL